MNGAALAWEGFGWLAVDVLGERESPVAIGISTPDILARIAVPIFTSLLNLLTYSTEQRSSGEGNRL